MRERRERKERGGRVRRARENWRGDTEDKEERKEPIGTKKEDDERRRRGEGGEREGEERRIGSDHPTNQRRGKQETREKQKGTRKTTLTNATVFDSNNYMGSACVDVFVFFQRREMILAEI